MTKKIARPSEKELDLALGVALRGNGEFREWLLSRTRFADEPAGAILIRDNWPWTKVTCRIWNREIAAYETISKESETDVLVVFQSARRGRFALHIENKRASGKFETMQADLYRARAMKWAANPECGDYEEWATILMAPQSFFDANVYEARKFDVFVSYENVSPFIPAFQV